MKQTKLYRISLLIIAISVCLLIIAIIAFVLNFNTIPLSSNLEKWGQFGDYVGGVLNPILAIVNICVFVILTLTIQNLTDKSNEKSIETSKKIALMSMKHEELNHFKEIMDRNLENWRNNLQSKESFLTVLYGYNVLEYRMLFLFPELRDSPDNKELRKYIIEASNNFDSGKLKEAAHCHIPISNIYGMLVSTIGEWTVK